MSHPDPHFDPENSYEIKVKPIQPSDSSHIDRLINWIIWGNPEGRLEIKKKYEKPSN